MQLISSIELCVLNPKGISCLAFIMYIQTVILTLVVASHILINMCNILHHNANGLAAEQYYEYVYRYC